MPAFWLAAEAGRRVSPVYEGSLNHLYPGDAEGTPSQMIAHDHKEVTLPLADHAVDLHSCGSSLIFPATLLRGPAHSPKEEQGLSLMTQAFDLPFSWVFTGSWGLDNTARTAMGATNRKAVINVMAELGGAGCVTPDSLRRTERGLPRILHALGMPSAHEPDTAQDMRVLYAKNPVHAYNSGLFDPLKAIGQSVHGNEVVALIHHPDTPSQAPDEVASPYGGMVLAMRAVAQVRRGNMLYQIAAEPA